MKKFNIVALAILATLVFAQPDSILAATTPSLGAASSYGILGNTYTNTTPGTTINGDVGYTTAPAVIPSINGTTHVADSSYNQAGIDQNAVLSALNSQSCNFNFTSATDLSLLPQPLTPGVYCITAAASVGTGGITLNGAGTYIFRVSGALTTVANSNISLSGGASACNVFWTPGGAATLGANSTFIGTDLNGAGITVGSTVSWTGRLLAFGGTVTTNGDTITVPSCSAPIIPTPTPTPTPQPTPSPTPVVVSPAPVVVITPVTTPNLPNTGSEFILRSAFWDSILAVGIISLALAIYIGTRKKVTA